MLWSALWIEALRARPGFTVASAGTLLAVAWFALPTLLFASPPLSLTEFLLAARQGRVDADAGGPFAAVLSWLAMDSFGTSAVYGLFAISLIVSTILAGRLARRFLGRAMGGAAALLFAAALGIALPLGPFDPERLALPVILWAVLEAWRVIGEGRMRLWPWLAASCGAALFTGWCGWAVVLAIALLFAFTREGRAAFRTRDFVQPVAVALTFLVPFVVWTVRFPPPLPGPLASIEMSRVGTMLLALMLALATGALLVLLSSPVADREKTGEVPEFARGPMPRFARTFLLTMGVVPLLVALLLTSIGEVDGLWATPAVPALMIALAGARGEHVSLHRRRLLPGVWLVCLLAPAAVLALTTVAAPEVGTAQDVNFPAEALAKPLTEVVMRRTGQPPAYVAGASALAAPLALAMPSKPIWLASEENSNLVPALRRLAASAGVLVVWRVLDHNRGAPLALREQWPGLVPETPIVAMRPIAGRLEPVRVGWAIVPLQPVP